MLINLTDYEHHTLVYILETIHHRYLRGLETTRFTFTVDTQARIDAVLKKLGPSRLNKGDC